MFGDTLRRTRHLIFLDTPHIGFDTRAWEIISGTPVNAEGEKQFRVWSTVLTDLGKTFAEIGSNISIISCYAGLATDIGESDERVGHTQDQIQYKR